MKTPTSTSRSSSTHFIILLALAVLVLVPLTGVLEIHHVLGEGEHHEQQHSDFDLCTWLEVQVSSTVVLAVPDVVQHILLLSDKVFDPGSGPFQKSTTSEISSRGPPTISI